jgi:nicotinamidase/pyrazinamidase
MDRRDFLIGLGGSMLLSARFAAAASRIVPGASDVLLVIDMQNCFMPGGTLPVSNGDAIIPLVNALGRRFETVVLTQDWHTPDHASFASARPGHAPFSTVETPYGNQVLWPDHCVQGTPDAQLAPGLDIPHAKLILRKGYHRDIDSYSAFREADGKTSTGLAAFLRDLGIERVFLVGVATDFCVRFSAVDARKERFRAVVIEDACRAIDQKGSLAAAWKAMDDAGVERLRSEALL